MHPILAFIESQGPFFWLSAGLAIAILDVFIASEFLLWLGLAVMTNGLWSYLGFSADLQILFTSCACFAITLSARRLMGHRVQRELLRNDKSLEGLRGRVTATNSDSPQKGIGAVDGHGEWSVCSVGGKLVENGKFIVIKRIGNQLEVMPESIEDA
jgi:membrane protein implicated in regulation of membrane protease activity